MITLVIVVSSFFFNFIYSFGCATQRVGSLLPSQGSNPYHLHWKRGNLTSGPPGQSLEFCINRFPQAWLLGP